jgi:hypothetical protein
MLQVWVAFWYRLDVLANVISHPHEKEKVSSWNRRCWFVYGAYPVPSINGLAGTNYLGPTTLHMFFFVQVVSLFIDCTN